MARMKQDEWGNWVKFCPCCKKTLPVEKFYRAFSEYDGHVLYCKMCDNKKRIERERKKYEQAKRERK